MRFDWMGYATPPESAVPHIPQMFYQEHPSAQQLMETPREGSTDTEAEYLVPGTTEEATHELPEFIAMVQRHSY